MKKVSNNDQNLTDSEDEFVASRIGNVPHKWYEKEDHLGYDVKGKKFETEKKS